MNKAAVDLGSEVGELRVGIEAAIALAMGWQQAEPDLETSQELSLRIAAVLNVTVLRLRHLERCLNGSRDPAELVAHHNYSIGPEGTHIPSWTPERRRAECERELRRLDQEERRGRRRRRS